MFIHRGGPLKFWEAFKRGGELMGWTCSSLMLRVFRSKKLIIIVFLTVPATLMLHCECSPAPRFRQLLKAGSVFTLSRFEVARCHQNDRFPTLLW
ncbi:unnamed protein product [Eruca vesicaria subsp. sativa]|uniref:Uncharacterized protein n=1 Tax=Eruca vesicaria subsp. sativa TaxID=29727 RepID=A0ABC8JMI4_ERUVS|nr:unnamed protein product [Eruca vesicaria subsp. sativa]